MQLKSLKVFCDVVGWRSFSRAADENGISQSGASQVVNQLEHRLGVKLIDRSKRPFVLTPEGETYYEGCRKLVQRYDALEDQVRTLHEEVAGRVRVVSIYSVGLHHMSRYLQQFLTQYPRPTCGSSTSIRIACTTRSKRTTPTWAWSAIPARRGRSRPSAGAKSRWCWSAPRAIGWPSVETDLARGSGRRDA